VDGAVHQQRVFVFERCRLDPISRTLTRDGARIGLQPRLFDTLLYLVQNPGRVLERDELLAALWPTRTVDEGSLGRAISSLREVLKAHGVEETLIVTSPGRGYRFGARVDFEPVVAEPAPASIATAPASAVPRHRRVGAVPLLCGLAALSLLAVLLPWRHAAHPAESAGFAPPPRSVAVLPFMTVTGLGGGAAEKDYLAEGLSQELINKLSRVGDIRVAARLPTFAFWAKPVPVRDIGRQLNVGMVLEGSLRHEGGHLHLTADLVDATSGFLVWTRSYDSTPNDLLALEGQIAAKVVTSLKGSLPDEDPVSLALGGTTKPDAFDAYLSGMVLMGPTNGEANQAATDAFTRAIALDPGYSEALVARARAQVYMAVNGGVTVGREGALLDGALADAQRAVAQSPRLGAAHAVLGLVLGCRLQDLGRAAAEYGQAVALAPYDAATVTSYALFQTDLGHMDQAVKEVTHATELDPLASVYDRMEAQILAYAGRFPEAFVALRHAASLPPADRNADRIFRGIVLTLQNDMAQAREVCEGQVDYLDLVCLALADHALGRDAEAQRAFDRLRTLQGDSGAYNYAGIYATWGRSQDALHWLQRAYELRDPGMLDIKIDPRLASLRGTDAYQAIVRQMGFPP